MIWNRNTKKMLTYLLSLNMSFSGMNIPVGATEETPDTGESFQSVLEDVNSETEESPVPEETENEE